MVYHGENAVRADQRPLTWMGCSGRDSRRIQTQIIQNFHAGYPSTGPSKADLASKLPVSRVFDLAKQVEVERKACLMRYTSSGEGCRLLERDEKGRTLSIRPGHNARLPGTATSAIEAAEATKFYPHQEHRIMEPKVGVPLQAFFNVIGTAEILDNVLSYLCYTDRASLSQSCREAALGVSNYQTVWFVNDEDFGDAEFLDEEFKHIAEANEVWDVEAPRGAKVLMVTMHACEYQPSNGFRPYSTYMKIASGMLRFLRAMDNTGCFIEHLVLKNVPFLDHKVLAGVVEFCPKLRKLEIPGCEQFTLFSVAPFLNFIEDVQEKRGKRMYFDVAPAFYKGVRWMDFASDKLNKCTHDRKGTFGVAESDPGCDIPTALCKLLLYDILPAMKGNSRCQFDILLIQVANANEYFVAAAGQLRMAYGYSSLFRQWSEALPAPRSCIAMILACWEVDEDIRGLKAAAEKEWRAELWDPQSTDPFTKDRWPKSLHCEVGKLETLRHWTVVRATCGENGWKQTADRGFYSCDYQCTVGNFMEHSHPLLCDTCDLTLPRIFFNACETCEGCRLEDRVLYRENDHLQHLKRKATAALGYGTILEPFRTNAESNFPFDAFRRDENGDLPVKTRADFARIVDSAPSLREFIDTAAELEVKEQLAGYRKGRKTIRQLDHPYAGSPPLYASGAEILARHPYRRALTHDDYAKSGGRGWEPANKEAFLKW
ncbi:hypothetical protein N0V93_001917 [Gnomoniopsis smithogilvyi]|uniref:F-box domain protein n=1 Tax=Gnomoniopsis smithogilvyi TaxID=1191159 RepID=A0A9W9D2N0_9PEZI|nr:hypothetical protein N0V93_001917 [Gnomoniopsis smithogilvyi]